ncbi:hypothetical protein PG995_005199 [Apiospora arundinis]
MRDHILDHHETVEMKSADCLLEISCAKSASRDFCPCWLNLGRHGGNTMLSRSQAYGSPAYHAEYTCLVTASELGHLNALGQGSSSIHGKYMWATHIWTTSKYTY